MSTNRDIHRYSIINIGAELTPEEVEFGRAMEEYRRKKRILFLSCSEMLKVAKSLGYRKVDPE